MGTSRVYDDVMACTASPLKDGAGVLREGKTRNGNGECWHALVKFMRLYRALGRTGAVGLVGRLGRVSKVTSQLWH